MWIRPRGLQPIACPARRPVGSDASCHLRVGSHVARRRPSRARGAAHTFIADDLLDRLPAPAQIGATRVGGVDLNKPRIRAALSAVLALSAAAGGFTVAEFTAKVHTMTGHTGYTIRQAAYDLRKLRGKQLVTK